MKVVGGLLPDDFSTLSAQIIDGFGELWNIIAGGIKGSTFKIGVSILKDHLPLGHHRGILPDRLC